MSSFRSSKDKRTCLKEFGGFTALIPALMLMGCMVALIPSFSRSAMLWLLGENHPIELASFFLFLVAGIIGIRSGFLVYGGKEKYMGFFFLLFGMLMLIIGMEEISWGQQLFGFETPDSLKARNAQGETNLHNVHALQGHSEWFRLLFGLAGICGILLRRSSRFRQISMPLWLLPWFGVIVLHAAVDVTDDLIPTTVRAAYVVQRSSEMVELLIAISGFLYIYDKRKRLRVHNNQSVPDGSFTGGADR